MSDCIAPQLDTPSGQDMMRGQLLDVAQAAAGLDDGSQRHDISRCGYGGHTRKTDS
jgi:hypothetical protein